MIQCKDCEYFRRGEKGEISFACDPFGTIKEPQCLLKWQLIKINQMVASYQSTLRYYEKFAPMQEKMFRMMEREIDDVEDAEKCKYSEDGENSEDEKNDYEDTDDDWKDLT